MFEKPKAEIVVFDLVDIITASDTNPICETDCATHNCPNDTGEFG